MKLLNLAFDLILKYEDISDFIGPKKETTIEFAQKKIEIFFPNSYHEFLLEKGSGSFGSLEIYGIVRDEKFENTDYTGSIPNIFWITIHYRKNFNLPHHIILISDVGDGSYYALDLSQMNDEQECPVVIWPVGGYDETPELEIVAPDFGTWFYDQVMEQIEMHKKQND
ncbi:MAG: hypothetical protein CNLJKLNK_01355 [Holosporales bacterium]